MGVEHSAVFNVILIAAGAVLVVLAALDIFFTILFPGSGRGPLRRPVTRVVWLGLRAIAKRWSGRRRRSVLAYAGPIQIVATLSSWFLALLLGWAMIYKPALGTEITAASGLTDTSWSTALYYSGFTLTTLGVGDIAANSGVYRILTVIEAAMGFSFFGMTITYFLSVYSALLTRNAFAEGLHQKSCRQSDGARLIANMAVDGDLRGAREELESSAATLRRIQQAQHFYPVMRYFQYRMPHHGLPRVLMTALDSVTLIKTALSQQKYGALIEASSVNQLHQSAISLLADLCDIDGAKKDHTLGEAWALRYQVAIDVLSSAGVSVRSDLVQGAREYVELRSDWDPALRSLADKMLFEWEEVEPDLA